ncbi:MFS transporter [Rhodococcus sp. OK302]|uniref:MFS transporter n=1 Tax=Rhodococcus sp. OK302 TaxID=1882769 RepID=UPI000B93DB97|nr:MFS transporter [Rhodococcus sp. OK302]OYD67815.1 putative MFS family arabinose efflux permease [Rhodococcus sp. OK302]
MVVKTLEQSTEKRSARAWLMVAASMFAVAWGGNEFTPLLVMYRLDHGHSPVMVDFFLFAYVMGIVPALLLGGPLSDRLGRRPLMLPAPLIAIAGSTLLAFGADSAAVLILGRILCGIALGLGMAVGGSWVKELSTAPWDFAASDGAGARRAAMSLTAGFALGAGFAGVLAQWAPLPEALAYVLHIAITVIAGVALWRAPETREAQPIDARRRLIDDLKIPAAGHRRFIYIVVPLAPWVFGAASVGYAVIPALMTGHSGDAPVAFSAFLCVVALTCGFAIQSLGRKIDTDLSARGAVVALVFLVIGMAGAALVASTLTVAVAVIAAAILGCGYGMALVSGLLEIQRIAGPDDLAGLTAVFYSITYVGFAVPAVLAMLSESIPALTYPLMLLFGSAAAAACLLVVLLKSRSHLPSGSELARR